MRIDNLHLEIEDELDEENYDEMIKDRYPFTIEKSWDYKQELGYVNNLEERNEIPVRRIVR